MLVDVVLLPRDLTAEHLGGRSVVVLDVLRATTTMVAALASCAARIRVCESIEEARQAGAGRGTDVLLSGEQRAVRPEGFDLGNSPREFTAEHVCGRSILMATTNGTRALVAARSAPRLYAAALVNASATARHLAQTADDVTLVCSGTGGRVAMEDVIGAGAIIDALRRGASLDLASDAAMLAEAAFKASQTELPIILRQTLGGRHLRAAGLEADIDFAAQLDRFDVVACVDPRELLVTRLGSD